ncbi:HlyD family secretion protein [Allorhodopirellula heiligendammensis]|uniref:Inner membrane protein YiaV n=1 Tax=Allorhodopirellula heiligendammensis TaxID=2714739 RepID=A0A5C6BYM4_9BACT|nr:efflux RND transporter periplasmic adaptor subunit [Allorhodopirellula heiligendammensis]TWU16561.1 Inner membrane protein YiaV precursor [Allorhodopirellula heiligendammensis]
MIALFTIIYVLGIWLFYIKMRIKPTPTNVAIAASIGFLTVGLITVLWQFSSPISRNLVVNRYTVQIVPQVKGPIEKIYAEPNEPLKKGKDKLFEIQKTPYQFTVNQLRASLEAAQQTVEQLSASVTVADAAIQIAIANEAAAEAQYQSAKDAENSLAGTIGAVQLEQYKQELLASNSSIDEAKASKLSAIAALAAAKSTVESTRANLDNAEFNLEQCTVYAPADGFVTNWQVREGSMAVSFPFAPMGTFIDTTEANVVATYGQNVVKNVKAGDQAEVVFKSRPGEVFAAKVVAVIQASGDGQFTTSGQLIDASTIHSSGQFAVKLKLDDESATTAMAMGTTGMATIYTGSGRPFHVISKVTVRIQAWMYYLLPF